jgi:hypothetical protein
MERGHDMVAKTYSHACVNVCGLLTQVYYFNTLTNESRWDTPPGWSEDMAAKVDKEPVRAVRNAEQVLCAVFLLILTAVIVVMSCRSRQRFGACREKCRASSMLVL